MLKRNKLTLEIVHSTKLKEHFVHKFINHLWF